MEWFTKLEWFEQTFWVIALIGSLFFLIMLVATFIGGDVDADVDVDADFDVDGGGFHFFTIKNLIAFFTIFGWTGIAAIDAGFGKFGTIAIATLCGLIMMTIMATLFYFVSKLNDSGTLDYKNAIGAIGEVYLTVGSKRSKIGKVSVRIQGSLREMEALTDEEDDLSTGTVVTVRDITTNGILIIDRLTEKQ
tara:strand:- start:18465 stop:19040 length:576 start_codon:yes stop_codon:yes gene_type:complete